MADKTIGELPRASQVTSGSLIPLEQSGVAQSMTGAQFQAWAVAGAQPYADAAAQSAQNAASSATNAASSSASASASAQAAETARSAIENMGVDTDTLPPGSSAIVTKTVDQQGIVTLTFGVPQGEKGDQGATGPTGATGAQGPQGVGGLAVPTDSQYAFTVDNNGHLICSYVGDTAPDFSIDENGHLILEI